MSDTSARLAVLQHQRRQRLTLARLEELAAACGGLSLAPLPASRSLQELEDVGRRISVLRAERKLSVSMFPEPGLAIDFFLQRSSALHEPRWSFYGGDLTDGAFVGNVPREVLERWLDGRNDGFLIFSSTLEAGLLFDAVTDDPVDGDFWEVETWGC